MTDKQKIAVAHWCGLIFTGWEDGAPQFMGTQSQFDLYYETLDRLGDE